MKDLISEIITATRDAEDDMFLTKLRLQNLLAKYTITEKPRQLIGLEYRVIRRDSTPKLGEFYSNSKLSAIFGPCEHDKFTGKWAVILERKELYDE